MDFFIRSVREEDAESIIEVLNPLIQEGTHTTMDELVSVADQIAFIRSFPQRGVYHVAVSNDNQRVLGLQDVLPLSKASTVFEHVGEISTFVSLTSHRRGIGRSLSQATFQAARDLGFIKLWATIRADNPRAVAFYSSQGFRIIGTAQKHVFVRGKYIDEILAEKFIA